MKYYLFCLLYSIAVVVMTAITILAMFAPIKSPMLWPFAFLGKAGMLVSLVWIMREWTDYLGRGKRGKIR